MRTASLSRSLLPALLASMLCMSLTACSGVSTKRYVAPEPPQVRCQKQQGPLLTAQPAADEWVAVKDGMATLSEQAALWIVDVLGVLQTERGLRAEEHRCLDDHEKRGLIRQ